MPWASKLRTATDGGGSNRIDVLKAQPLSSAFKTRWLVFDADVKTVFTHSYGKFTRRCTVSGSFYNREFLNSQVWFCHGRQNSEPHGRRWSKQN
ncbi:hypothetical protein HMPREF9554_02567 [Treponema phagedenis F0421]|nr:hypothetical protein HMPREF9554_02567 [Treponema phagedenis F0421]